MRNSGKAPTMIVWIICLVLFVLALAAHFGVINVNAQIAAGAWIVGFALLLVACQVKGL
jgi:hypothetical protein